MEYVEGEQVAAEEEGHPSCVNNRLMLEKAWQVVANEFFDPRGSFSQAAWAHQLLDTLKVSHTPATMGPITLNPCFMHRRSAACSHYQPAARQCM